jgi:CRISPR/Cas system-associated endonuclease Cas1
LHTYETAGAGAPPGHVPRGSAIWLRQVVLFGNVQISTQALVALAMLEIPVVYLNAYGKFIGVLETAPKKNIHLRLDQYRVFSDPVRALGLAREVVKAKIANQRTLLMRSLRSMAPMAGEGSRESGKSKQNSIAKNQ